MRKSTPHSDRIRNAPRQVGWSAVLAVIGLLLLIVLLVRPVRALTINVDGAAVSDGTNGVCSLFEAIQNANDEASGQPNPDCAPGTPNRFVLDTVVLPDNTVYTIPTTLPVIHSMITVEGNGSTIRREPTDPNRFRLITLAECYDPAGATGCFASGDLTLNDLTLSGGYDDGSMPGYGTHGGGAIASFGNFLTLNNCVVIGNTTVSHGGAINGSTAVTINDSVISNNVAAGDGGAIRSGGPTHRLNGTTLSNNRAFGNGGGIAIGVNGAFLTDTIITDNLAGLDGGGVYAPNGSVEALQMNISGNDARHGGGVYSASTARTTWIDSTVADNTATGNGGGIWSQGELIVTRSTFSGNTADGDGGGLYHNASSPMSLFNSTVSGNVADGNGGGIQNTSGSVGLQNNTITGNSAARGGGIDFVSTLSGLQRTIVAGNNSPLGREMHASVSSTNVNWANVFGYGGDAGLIGVSPGGGDLIPSGPITSVLNTALADNSGLTHTHALVAGSIAIDRDWSTSCNSGSVLAEVDQRGLPRNVDGNGIASALECDSGSYELQGIPPTDTPTPMATNTPEPTATATSSPTPEPTATATSSPTPEPTATATSSPTPEPTATATASPTPEPTATPTDPAPEMVFGGFLPPVDTPPVVNGAKGGSGIPVKFSLGGDFGLDIFEAGYPASQRVTCDSSAPLDAIEQTVTAGQSGLQFDPATGQYTFVWKTQKTWGNTCRQLIIRFSDGQEQVALFNFR